MIRSAVVLDRVIQDVRNHLLIRDTADRWSGNSHVDGEQMVDLLRASLQLKEIHNIDVEIGLYWDDPEIAATMANAVAGAYRDTWFQAMRDKIDADLALLKQEVEKQKKVLEDSFAEAAKIRTREGIIDPDPESFGASLQAADKATVVPYIDAKTRYIQGKRIHEAAQIKYSSELLARGGDVVPVRILELAKPSQHPVPFSLRRFKFALKR
jgi:uncharacterized protein involved in exopolysaccharide biosynthesis